MPAPLLALERISKRFGAVVVAERLDLTLGQGEALGIIGPNGAGKTTLFGMIGGTVAPDAGRVLYAGRDITGLSPAQRCTRGIGRSFQIPQPFAGIGGVITILFQLTIIVSGNLSWLNWLTVVIAFSTFDRQFLHLAVRAPEMHMPAPVFQWLNYGMAGIVVLMSIPVVINMASPGQIMNTSFNVFHLVGTYGAFGSITRPRYEVIVEGADDAVITSGTRWREYEFKAKPGHVRRIPPQYAPYHLRLDWLMWFAAMSSYQDYPWFVNVVAKLLQGDKDVLSLIRTNPFPTRPPKYVRAQLYEYHFTTPEERRKTGNWWKRTYTANYFPTISLESPGFRQVLKSQRWLQ